MIQSRKGQLPELVRPPSPIADRRISLRMTRDVRSRELDQALESLLAGRRRLERMSANDRIRLLASCIEPLDSASREWVDLSCDARGIPAGSPTRCEEVVSGPASVMRQLQMYLQTMREIARYGAPRLTCRTSSRTGRLGIQVTPCRGFQDRATFINFRVTTWMQSHVTRDNLLDYVAVSWNNLQDSGTSLVLGAGNVSAIPATDLLSRLCVENRTVLLKMSPVNEYLRPVLERAFAPLIDHDLLRIVCGGAQVGAAAVADERVDDIHVTGSAQTWNTIVHGRSGSPSEPHDMPRDPVIGKAVTGELGSVSPWIVVPGAYSRAQLGQQAENIVGSLTNNAAFNCVSTRVILTWKRWPERENFLQRVQALLGSIGQRRAYYPGAMSRYEDFAGLTPERARAAVGPTSGERTSATVCVDGRRVFLAGPRGHDQTLPWTLFRDVDPHDDLPLFSRESFVCVCAEVAIDAETPEDFVRKAVEYSNERLWGTLAVSMSVPRSFRRQHREPLEDGIDRLRYGTVSLNQWAALAYALITPPWGGWSQVRDTDIQSGVGWVHNAQMLTGVEKTVLDAPLVVQPKPVWHPTHGDPEPVSWALYDMAKTPSLMNMARLSLQAVKGALAGGR